MRTAEQRTEQMRDGSGRLLAEDGWPVSGNARVAEAAAAGGVSAGLIYKMVSEGELAVKRFGRSVRIPWREVRRVFLAD